MKHIFIFLLFLFITKPLLAEMVCDTDINKYFALYEIDTYTCASGYYLPANTDGCRACPTGYTCPGGTFEFNPNTYQGAVLNNISTTTMNNVCAANFPIKLFAVYEPNTVTITWDDGTNTIQNTCDYGDAVTIPPTPTRPGYVFNGWRVKVQN